MDKVARTPSLEQQLEHIRQLAEGVVPTTYSEDQQRRRRLRRADPQPSKNRARITKARRILEEGEGLDAHPLETAELAGHPPDPEAHPHTQPLAAALVTATGNQPGLPQTTPPLLFAEEPRDNLLLHTIFQLYLRGYPREAIAKKVDVSSIYVRTLLKRIKKTINIYMEKNPQVFGAPLEALYLQVLRRRERQSAVWEELGRAPDNTRPALYRILGDEDRAIEGLLGLDHRTLSIVTGSPMEHARADLIKSLGPQGLKDLLQNIRQTHHQLTGSTQIDLEETVAPMVAMDGGVANDERLERKRRRRAGRTAGPR